MKHHLDSELWEHLRADDSVEEKKKKPKLQWPSAIDGVSGTEERSAHLPLKRIQPANTRGQRWQAWRMRAAFSRRSGSTCRGERQLCMRREGKHFTLHTHKCSSFLFLHRRVLRHSHFLWKPQKQRSGSCRSETYVRSWRRWSSSSWRHDEALRSPTEGATGTEPSVPLTPPDRYSAETNIGTVDL